MNSTKYPKLFTPLGVGPITLAHRVVMLPLTRGDPYSRLAAEP
jgi:2,4-dienoyl-CoA reductase-like NADH-dependent reductase (Old Yellow Enzyme family)